MLPYTNMPKAYPWQVHIRLDNEAEKKKVKAFAKQNKMSIGALGRLVILRAIEEGWTMALDISHKVKK